MLWNRLIRPRWADLVAGKNIDVLVPDGYHPQRDPVFRIRCTRHVLA